MVKRHQGSAGDLPLWQDGGEQDATPLKILQVLLPHRPEVPPNPIDPSKLLGLGWTPSVSWRDGFRKNAETSFPDLFKG